ncbi:BON domain-containing protein [Ramlibacter tataouinensis]|uniref:BON domain-containing protein n=1 Tax=Ramlibacter tataouinensis TaxID=94132 RepID=UPI00031D235D|nr:BON domain-containing protein [Ramlibacter tataouinensis]
MNHPFRSRGLVAASSLAVLLALGACGERNDGQTVGQKIDEAIANTAETAKDVKQGAQQAAGDVKQGAQEAAADAKTAGQKIENKTEELSADAKSATQEAASKTKEATAEARTSVMGAAGAAKEKTQAAGERVGAKVDDAQITTSVKSGLAADKNLSATQIDVDTRDGVVTLKGTAPSAAAKSRANEIARNVKDVKSVNNQLTVRAG